jgi:hypothetical protein
MRNAIMSGATPNGQKAFETLTQYLNVHGWNAERLAEQTAFKAHKEGELCPLVYYFQIKSDLEQFLFYVVPDINLFEQMLQPTAEYVCRANHGLRIGNFELDFRAGRLSFKSSLNFRGVELTDRLLDNVIQPALTAFDEFFPGASNVIAGLDSPADAIRKMEYGE